MTLYPWQIEIWQRLLAARRTNRLPHGLLLSGPQGTGKGTFALLFARSMLCKSALPDGLPCGACGNCMLLQAGTHPDLLQLLPEEEGGIIKIDQIRELTARLALTSGNNEGTRIGIIDPADAMNRNAANSLLKTLEEPPAGTVLLLVSARPSALPVTVRSRCQQLCFSAGLAAKHKWLDEHLQPGVHPATTLALAGGGPLLAVAMQTQGLFAERGVVLSELQLMRTGKAEPITTALRWGSLGMSVMLKLLTTLIQDLIRVKLIGTDAGISHGDLLPGLQAAAETLDLAKLFAAHDLLVDHWRLSSSGVNVREQDLLEEFAIGWAE